MKDKIINYFKAAYPGLAIQTTEEQRAIAEILAAAKDTKKGVWVWSCTEGFKKICPSAGEVGDTEDVLAALRQRPDNTILIFRDAQTFPIDKDPVLPRAVKDLLTWAPKAGSCAVFVGANFNISPVYEKLISMVEFSLPDRDSLKKICEGAVESTGEKIEITEDILRALSGLSTTEAENALYLSYIETKTFDPKVIYREKTAAVKKSGLLEIIDPDPRGLDAIGGLEELKKWIGKRRRAFTPEAAKYGLPLPKGVLITGVPGTGKSLCAKAIGIALGVPTIKLDIGKLFNSLVGESEARTRDALKLAEAVAPCVLWTDEIEKGLAGASGSGSNDSGVTKRVFGTILTWLQERKRPVFLVATANQVDSLPPEFLRKGRFDEIFAVDLPNIDEREEIVKIHLNQRNRDVKKFEVKKVVEATKDFTGSEIEEVVVAALYNAFDENREIETKDLVVAAGQTVPLAQTAKEQVEYIRTWAKTRARFASKTREEIAKQFRKITN